MVCVLCPISCVTALTTQSRHNSRRSQSDFELVRWSFEGFEENPTSVYLYKWGYLSLFVLQVCSQSELRKLVCLKITEWMNVTCMQIFRWVISVCKVFSQTPLIRTSWLCRWVKEIYCIFFWMSEKICALAQALSWPCIFLSAFPLHYDKN